MILALKQALVEELVVAKQRRETLPQLARVAQIGGIEARRRGAPLREPRKNDRRKARTGVPRANAQGAAEKSHDALRVHREIGAAPARALNHRAAVDGGGDELHRI